MRNWLLFVYKVPPTPTANRVYVWRKLKQLGAILLHDAVWVLPSNERTREQFQWLAAEIVDLTGEALVWEAQLTMPGQDQALQRQFGEQTETAYQALLADLEKPERDLGAIARRYQQVKLRDHLNAPLGEQVRLAIRAAQEILEPTSEAL